MNRKLVTAFVTRCEVPRLPRRARQNAGERSPEEHPSVTRWPTPGGPGAFIFSWWDSNVSRLWRLWKNTRLKMLSSSFVGAGEKDERSAISDPAEVHFSDFSFKKNRVNEHELLFSADKRRVDTRALRRRALTVGAGENTPLFSRRVFTSLRSSREKTPPRAWRSWPSSWRCWRKIWGPAAAAAPLCPPPVLPSPWTGLQWALLGTTVRSLTRWSRAPCPTWPARPALRSTSRSSPLPRRWAAAPTFAALT